MQLVAPHFLTVQLNQMFFVLSPWLASATASPLEVTTEHILAEKGGMHH